MIKIENGLSRIRIINTSMIKTIRSMYYDIDRDDGDSYYILRNFVKMVTDFDSLILVAMAEGRHGEQTKLLGYDHSVEILLPHIKSYYESSGILFEYQRTASGIRYSFAWDDIDSLVVQLKESIEKERKGSSEDAVSMVDIKIPYTIDHSRMRERINQLLSKYNDMHILSFCYSAIDDNDNYECRIKWKEKSSIISKDEEGAIN